MCILAFFQIQESIMTFHKDPHFYMSFMSYRCQMEKNEINE